MKVLSLFDGISCGYVALLRAGIKIDNYTAIEFDKYPRIVSDYNFPDIIRPLHDVRDFQIKGESFDLILGGSPCQSLSITGDGSGFEGKSGLFFEYVRILKEAKVNNPNIKFLLENVKMKKEWECIITESLGVEPIHIDSSTLSAQNRKRLYWTNISGVTIPTDKGLTIVDIIESIPLDDSRYIPLPEKYQTQEIIDRLEKLLSKNNIIISQVRRCSYLRINEDQLHSPTLTANMGTGGYNMPIFIVKDRHGKLLMRNMSANECELLQTLPVGFTKSISASQRYKAIGNGWTIDVIAHIFSYLDKKV